MKKLLLSSLAFAGSVLANPHTSVATDDYFVFKVSVSLPLTHVIIGQATDKVVTKSLSGNDLVNLSLGRPLGSPVDKAKEVLALGFTFAGTLGADQRPTMPPLIKVMIYDTTATGTARKVQEIATITTLDYQEAFPNGGSTNKGLGICTGTLLKTPATVPPPGDPSKFEIKEDANFQGAASVTQPGSGTGGDVESFNLTATGVSMRLKITLTDNNGVTAPIDGYVLKGIFKTTGKRIDTYTE